MSYDADLTEDELSGMINNYQTYVEIQPPSPLIMQPSYITDFCLET
jgi:hypothetical protein